MRTNSIRNRSQGSEPEKTGGRQPVLTDDELDHCVKALAQDLGRMPKLDEIVEAAGGCQRKRAVEARRRLADSLSTQAVEEWTDLPPSIVTRHKRLLREWLALAREQLTPWIDEVVAQSLEESTKLELRIAEQSSAIERHEETERVLKLRLDELQRSLNTTENALIQCQRQAAVWEALAEERRNAPVRD